MSGYLLGKAAALGGLLLAASVLVFSLMEFAPGDPAELILRERRGGEPAAPEAVDALRHELGLDRPAPVRYARWLAGAVAGDFGLSFRSGRPVAGEFGPRLLRTVLLALGGATIAVLLSLALGVAAAARAGSALDRLLLVLSSLVAATPVFVLGLLFVLVFSLGLGAFPAAGASTPAHYVLPALTLGIAGAAVPARVLRSSLREELSREYVTSARALGIPEERILYVHALRNALLPWLTLTGLMLRGLLAGAVLVEGVFDFPGVGSLVVEAVALRDIPVLQAGVAVFVVATVLVNLLTDLGYVALDPRVRLAGGRA